jgi:hypothetical protein
MEDDKKFYDRLEDKRHKEIISSLRQINDQLSKEKKDDGIAEALYKQTATIQGFVEAIKGLPKPDAPRVTVNGNTGEVVRSINDMCELIVKGLGEIKEMLVTPEATKKEWKFEIRRTIGGYIDSVTAKEK